MISNTNEIAVTNVMCNIFPFVLAYVINKERFLPVISDTKENDGIIVFNFRPDRLRELFKTITNNEFNAVILETYPNDTLTFIGKGAGSLPTASAIISDIVDIINGKNIETYNKINKYIIK